MLPSPAIVMSTPAWTTCALDPPVSRPSIPTQADTALAPFPKSSGTLRTMDLGVRKRFFGEEHLRDSYCDGKKRFGSRRNDYEIPTSTYRSERFSTVWINHSACLAVRSNYGAGTLFQGIFGLRNGKRSSHKEERAEKGCEFHGDGDNEIDQNEVKWYENEKN